MLKRFTLSTNVTMKMHVKKLCQRFLVWKMKFKKKQDKNILYTFEHLEL